MSTKSEEFQKWLRQIEKKWQQEWETEKVFEADPVSGKPKFFITVAYPYVNSPQHIGHGRTYGMTDTYARFKRMQGMNVLYPQGFHYTGTPILAMAKRIAEGDEEIISDFKNVYHVPDELITEFQDPLKLARYFHEEIRAGMKAMGFSIDWRREFTTIDPIYQKFIEWQFQKLHEKGFLTKGSHPVGWCPKCGNAVGMHDTLHDKEPEIGEVTVLKIPFEGKIMPTATYRPETIFGLTNIFINPDITYKIVVIDGEEWILSQEAIFKLRHQAWEIKEIENGEILGKDLIEKYAEHPLSGEKLPILPADFVDPAYGTGIVMSVPAHAPFDYIALIDLERSSSVPTIKKLAKSIESIPVIQVEGFGEIPAKDAIEQFNVKDQNDPAVEKATDEVYSREFHTGTMLDNTGEYAGLPVTKAKDRVHEDLIAQGKAKLMYELTNRPVFCRCGTECVVHVMPNQWFLDYGIPRWKELAYNCLNEMAITPEKLRHEFERVFDWLSRRACARKSGLGTPFPYDPTWIIESLSDSTIYMAYYTLAKAINQYNLNDVDFSNEVFDYVFLGKRTGVLGVTATGSRITQEIIEEMRADFSYYYPLDSRNSGRDLVPNHLSFFVFNHVAIFPKEYWPRQIFVNGSVLMEGESMSKSLGNIIPIREAVGQYSADLIRLTVLYGASLLTDADFNPKLVRWITRQMEKLKDLAAQYEGIQSDIDKQALQLIDKWILAILQERIASVTRFLEIGETRDALQQILYSLNQDIEIYLQIKTILSENVGDAVTKAVMRRIIETGIKPLAPFAPHFCEELWEILGNKKFVSTEVWPTVDLSYEDEEVRLAVEMVLKTIQDVKDIKGVLKEEPLKGNLILAPQWKYDLFKVLSDLISKGTSSKELVPLAMRNEQFRMMGKEAVGLVNAFVKESPRFTSQMNESTALNELKRFIEKETHLDTIEITTTDEVQGAARVKAKQARPGRPAIYLE
ncbi:MAG: leucine--tRNA ligase [Candidatus Heimdallarchaeota archaeon]